MEEKSRKARRELSPFCAIVAVVICVSILIGCRHDPDPAPTSEADSLVPTQQSEQIQHQSGGIKLTADDTMRKFLRALQNGDEESYSECGITKAAIGKIATAIKPIYLDFAKSQTSPLGQEEIELEFEADFVRRQEQLVQDWQRGYEKLAATLPHIAGFSAAEFKGSAVELEIVPPIEFAESFAEIGYRSFEKAYLYFQTDVDEVRNMRFVHKGASRTPNGRWVLGRVSNIEFKGDQGWESFNFPRSSISLDRKPRRSKQKRLREK